MSAVQAIAVVMIRLWAVGYVISVFFAVFQSISFLLSEQEMFQGLQGYLSLAAQVFLLAFWVLVLVYSRTVTAWVLPPVKEADHRIRLAPEDLISAGTFLVGVYYLTQYVPDLLRSMPGAVIEIQQTGHAWSMLTGRLTEFTVSIIAILISLWLVLRPSHLVRLFSWLRTAGQPKEDGAEKTTQAE
ncbi:MAG: hypothetical protein ACLFV8_07025 [Alphaproteobacteria bacterium]